MADDSDASDRVIEIFVTIFADVCRLFTIIRRGPWLSGVRSTLSVSPASRPPQCRGLNFPSSDTNLVNFHIEYVYNFNHFSTTGRCSGPACYDVSIRQAARVAFVTSSFKLFLTQTFPRCGAMCYILPSRAMTQLFNGVNFLYRSVEVYLTFCSYLRVLVRIRKLIQWRTVLTTLAISRVMF